MPVQPSEPNVLTPKELRSRRIALGLSLEDFARASGLPDSSLLGTMENGDAPITSAIFVALTRLEHEHRTGKTN